MGRVRVNEIAQDLEGNAKDDASLQVNIHGGAAATVFASETGGGTLSNPIPAEANGGFLGWLDEPEDYDLTLTIPGFDDVTTTIPAIAGATVKTHGARHSPEGDDPLELDVIFDAGVTFPADPVPGQYFFKSNDPNGGRLYQRNAGDTAWEPRAPGADITGGVGGPIPSVLTNLEQALVEAPAWIIRSVQNLKKTSGWQTALLVRINHSMTFSSFRWKYASAGGNPAGTYCIGLYDVNGDKIVATGAVAFAAGGVKTESVTPTAIDPDWYYLLFGQAFTANDASALSNLGSAAQAGVPCQNIALYKTTGGATAPADITTFTDLGLQTAGTDVSPVPVVVLAE